MKEPSKKKGSVGGGRPVHWSKAEDEALRKLVAEHGTKKWTLISTILKTKHSKQCRRRWKNGLSEQMKSCEWTSEEDRILMDTHKKVGNRWTEIAKNLSGRTDNAVKNRYFALAKRSEKSGSMTGRSADSSTSRFSDGCCVESDAGEAHAVDAQPLTSEFTTYEFSGLVGHDKEMQEWAGIPLDSILVRSQPTTHLMDALDLVHELPGDLLSFW